jgi:hypothetical protein
VAILACLGVGIYFIIADALETKTENCLFKYFLKEDVIKTYNVTEFDHLDPNKISYSDEDCKKEIEDVRKKTMKKIDNDPNATPCIKNKLKETYLDAAMMVGVLDYFNRNSASISKTIKTEAFVFCKKNENSTQT